MKGMRKNIIFLTFLVILILSLCGVVCAAKTTERVSIGADGTQTNSDSLLPSISSNGRYVAFASEASNLVTDDTNENRDVFVKDRTTGVIELISRGLNGKPANGASSSPSLSANGRYVAFFSNANDLVSGGTNMPNIYVYDREGKTTEQISIGLGGSLPTGISLYPSISEDGRMVTFYSQASNLVNGDNNSLGDIFVRDLFTKSTIRVSISSAGNQANGNSGTPAISGNGRYVAFSSEANNLVSNDTNNRVDIFIHDLFAHTTEIVTQGLAGAPSNGISLYTPSLSQDGRYIVFDSTASNLVGNDNNDGSDVYVWDRVLKTIMLVSVSFDGLEAAGGAMQSISADGKFVAFASDAKNIIEKDSNGASDIFLRDLVSKSTKRVSVGPGGIESSGGSSGGNSFNPSLNGQGNVIAYSSEATNLVSGDTNTWDDIFVYQSSDGLTTLPNEDITTKPPIYDDADGPVVNPNNASGISVGATSETVSTVNMEETGIPFWVLFISVLLLLTGMIVPRK
jgi:Tol biopolymer transport system component